MTFSPDVVLVKTNFYSINLHISLRNSSRWQLNLVLDGESSAVHLGRVAAPLDVDEKRRVHHDPTLLIIEPGDLIELKHVPDTVVDLKDELTSWIVLNVKSGL